jgi:hypothetical protein
LLLCFFFFFFLCLVLWEDVFSGCRYVDAISSVSVESGGFRGHGSPKLLFMLCALIFFLEIFIGLSIFYRL